MRTVVGSCNCYRGSEQWAVGGGQWAVGSGRYYQPVAVGSGQWAVGSGAASVLLSPKRHLMPHWAR